MSSEHGADVVRLASAANAVEAHIWEQALTEQGIECKVVGDYLDSGIGDLPGISPEVWVHRDELARAESILRMLPAQAAQSENPELEEAEEEVGKSVEAAVEVEIEKPQP
jgi:hypothetical protein